VITVFDELSVLKINYTHHQLQKLLSPSATQSPFYQLITEQIGLNSEIHFKAA